VDDRLSLGGRMKRYEKIVADLQPNTPLIIRLDGRAFHTFTRGMEKPFDTEFMSMMNHVALGLVNEIQNSRLAFVQSDEISILVYDGLESDTWFGNDIQKITSVSSSLASALAMLWNQENKLKEGVPIVFDSRVFPLPLKDVANYFVWRQMDWERNSLQMFARSLYSHKEMHMKNREQLHQMLFEKGKNWNNLPIPLRRGRCAVRKPTKIMVDNEHYSGEVTRNKWMIDFLIPIFTKEPEYIQNELKDGV